MIGFGFIRHPSFVDLHHATMADLVISFCPGDVFACFFLKKAFQGSRLGRKKPFRHFIMTLHTFMISFFVLVSWCAITSRERVSVLVRLCCRCCKLRRCLKLAVLLRLNTWLVILYRCGWFGQATGIVALKYPLEHRKNTGRLRECVVCLRERNKNK